MQHAGSGHSVYLLGDDLVLRVPHNHPLWVEAAWNEATVVPIVRAAGVRAPALVAFDAACDLLPVPYTIYERVPGTPLHDLGDREPETIPHVWRELGRDLAMMHTRITPAAVPGRFWPLAPPYTPDPRPWADELARSGFFIPAEARWLLAWLDRLTPAALLPAPLRFVHGDVQTMNIMVAGDPPTYQALLDWAGAGWGRPAQDFWAVPLRAVHLMLEGYDAIAPRADDSLAEERIAWSYAQLALFFLWRGRQEGAARAAPRVQRLLSSLHSFLTTR